MEALSKDIQESRNIKPNSLRAYLISIKRLHERIEGNKEMKDLDWLKDEKKVIGVLEDMKQSTKKNYTAAIIVALSSQGKKYETEVKQYREFLDGVAKAYKEEVEEQTKSEKESKNWVRLKKLRKVMNGYKREIMERDLLRKDPDTLTNKEFNLIQKWVVASLYILDENPPLRNDYIMEVISKKKYDDMTEADLKKGNYLVVMSRNKKFFSLGQYKTDKKYDTKRIDLGKQLNSVMNVWLRINKSGHLILNSQRKPITSNGLTKYLNKVFEPTGKSNISSTMLRHIFITEKIGGPALKEKQELADKMGHSVEQQELYKKV